MTAKSRKQKQRSDVEVPPPSRLSRLLASLWRPMPLVLMATALSAVTVGPHLKRWLPDLPIRPEYQIAWNDISVTAPHDWVPEDFVDQVRLQSHLPAELSLLDDELVSQLAVAFGRHPWVNAVESVAKERHGIRVQLTYREPVLMVQTRRGCYPVDADGILLPPSDFTAADVEPFPKVVDVKSNPQGPAGTPWGDLAVSGAARLAVCLSAGDTESAWQRYHLTSIVVVPQRGPVASVEDVVYGLTTSSGSRIVWGHAPGADALEPTVEQKLQKLDTFLTDVGPFEYLEQPVYVDITDWEVIRWEVLSEVNTETMTR